MVIRRRTGCTAQITPRALVAALFALCLAAAGCSSGDELGAGDAATVSAGFVAEYALDDGAWTQREGGEVIPEGAQVRPADGELRLTLRDGAVRLAPGALVTVAADRIIVQRGEVLIDSDGALGGAVEDTTVDGAGQYRLSAGLAARVGVYRGRVAVQRPAQERSVGPLRQLDLASFRLAAAASPLQYVESDAWDQELLGDAIAFDAEAERLERGLDLELGTRPQAPGFYRQFAAPAVVGLVADAATVTVGRRFGPPSDVLLTVFVARAAASDEVAPAVRQVTTLRADGARWGLIARELRVSSDSVVAAIDRLGAERLALGDSPAPDVNVADAATAVGAGGGAADALGDSIGAEGQSQAGTPTSDGGGSDGAEDDGGSEPNPPGSGGSDPNPPGSGGGGEEPKTPPPPPPPGDPVERVVNEVVDGISDPPGEDDADSTIPVPEPPKGVDDLLDN